MTDWAELATGASGDIEVERAYLRRVQQGYQLFCKKQKDYGRGNIYKRGEEGVAIRLSDKVERLNHLHTGVKSGSPMNEAITDTWLDVHVYGAIGLMCHHGTWPAPEHA